MQARTPSETDMRNALACVQALEDLMGVPARASVACVNAQDSLPPLPVQLHLLQNVQERCRRCARVVPQETRPVTHGTTRRKPEWPRR